jgi:hypothetical protein
MHWSAACIETVPGVTDGGGNHAFGNGNHAFGNGNPLQCLNVDCQACRTDSPGRLQKSAAARAVAVTSS